MWKRTKKKRTNGSLDTRQTLYFMPRLPLRTKIIREAYRSILKPIFFHRDPEDVHEFMTSVGSFFGSMTQTQKLTRRMFSYNHPMLEQTILGIRFKNPIGLAAGFDKNATLTDILPDVG